VDTDIITLAGLPQNLLFVSPSRGCNVSCGDLISEIELVSAESVNLANPESGISFLFDLSLLVQRPANISLTYGNSESQQLLIRRSATALTLRDIPDLRLDVSKVASSAAYITFPGPSWPTKLEDISSKIEIYHDEKPLYIYGGLVDVGAYYTPPTIFHSGAGQYYVNGILSTFKTTYCLCSEELVPNCADLCIGYGPVIDFDNESIHETIPQNPSRHITYYIAESTEAVRPVFNFEWLLRKSFTIGGSKGQKQIFTLEGYRPEPPDISIRHTFRYVKIYLSTFDTAYYFSTLELTEVQFFPEIGCDYDINEVALNCDLYSMVAFVKGEFPITALSLYLVGEQTLTTIILESRSTITLSSTLLPDPGVFEVTVNLETLESAVRIQSEYGVSPLQQLHIELPNNAQCSLDTIPNVILDVSAIVGSTCHIIFPTGRWTGSLANISTKFAVEYLRHDLYTESSTHEGKYDGDPPFIRTIGTGDYYRNGVKVVPGEPMPTGTPTPEPFAPIEGMNWSVIFVGIFSTLAVVAGVVVFIFQLRKKMKKWKADHSEEESGAMELAELAGDASQGSQ
jgi:hypothetical protein